MELHFLFPQTYCDYYEDCSSLLRWKWISQILPSLVNELKNCGGKQFCENASRLYFYYTGYYTSVSDVD